MADTKLDIEHVAHLARLDLTADERALFGPQLLHILEYVETLQALPTDDIEATFQVLPLANVLRDDVQRPGLDRDAALANAPRAEDGCFRVPRIL